MNTRIFSFLAAVVVAAALVASCGSSDQTPSGSGGTSPVEIGEPSVEGAPLPLVPEAGEDPAVGSTVPAVTSQTFDGSTVGLLTEGRPAVLLVAAHWCPHCQTDVAALREFLEDGGSFGEGVELVVVHTWPAPERGNWPPSKWLGGLADRVLLDDEAGTAATALGLTSTPMWVVVDADGNVVERVVGAVDPTQVAAWAEDLTAA